MSSPRAWSAGLLRAAFLTCALAISQVASAARTIQIVLDKDDNAHIEFLHALQATLLDFRLSEFSLEVQSVDDFKNISPTLIVTAGTEAARLVTQRNPSAPILYTLLPRNTAMELRAGAGSRKTRRHDSALYLDQPPALQLDLLHVAIPTRTRPCVILGPTTKSLAPELRAAAQERSLKLEIATVATQEDVLPALEKILNRCEALLSVPDPLVYRGETIHHLLLTTYRYRIPLIGMSKAYVEAGALLAAYSTAENAGKQVGEILASLPKKGKIKPLPPPQPTSHFHLSVNSRVAASLNITLDDEHTLLRRLETLRSARSN
jgi:ABC-type uncharacterized transport system substrate-binding protein